MKKIILVIIIISIGLIVALSLLIIRSQAIAEKNVIIQSMIPPLHDCPSSGLIGAFECWSMRIDIGIIKLNEINSRYGILLYDPQTNLRERAVRALDQDSECASASGGLTGLNEKLKCVIEIMQGKR